MTDAPREPGFYWVKWTDEGDQPWVVMRWADTYGWYYGSGPTSWPAVIGPRIEPPE